MKESQNTYECAIKIDKEGIWYYRGAEMFRKDIVNYLSRHLCQDEQGRYLILVDGDSEFVEVEDTPLVITAIKPSVEPNSVHTKIRLIFSDNSEEDLDPSSLRIGPNNVPYCRVRNNTLDARFNRPSYYQLANLIKFQEGQGFYLLLNGKKYFLQIEDKEIINAQ